MSGRMHEDRYGLPLSTNSAAAASAYCDGTDKMLSAWTGAAAAFECAMADHDQARQDLGERHAPHYGEDWWFLSNYGWSLTENGQVAKGRAMTERGFELRRQNAYAAHALLHAMFEDGSVDDADALVTQ